MDIGSLLSLAHERKASDLHIKVGNHPLLRINGSLEPATDLPVLDAATVRVLITSMMDEGQRETFREHLELDFAYSVSGLPLLFSTPPRTSSATEQSLQVLLSART